MCEIIALLWLFLSDGSGKNEHVGRCVWQMWKLEPVITQGGLNIHAKPPNSKVIVLCLYNIPHGLLKGKN